LDADGRLRKRAEQLWYHQLVAAYIDKENTIMTGGADTSNNNVFLTMENLAFSLPLIAVCSIYVSTSCGLWAMHWIACFHPWEPYGIVRPFSHEDLLFYASHTINYRYISRLYRFI
jgi:hypothetical protein